MILQDCPLYIAKHKNKTVELHKYSILNRKSNSKCVPFVRLLMTNDIINCALAAAACIVKKIKKNKKNLIAL